jgi:hypothetical protein
MLPASTNLTLERKFFFFSSKKKKPWDTSSKGVPVPRPTQCMGGA